MRNLLKPLLLLFISFLLLCLLELLVRHLKLRNAGDESRDHVVEVSYMPAKLKSNYEGRIWNQTFSTNRYGFRGEPGFSLQPTKSEFRLMALGDSIGVGLGIKPFHHYTKVLEKYLNRPGTPRRFHHQCGWPRLQPFQLLRLLEACGASVPASNGDRRNRDVQ